MLSITNLSTQDFCHLSQKSLHSTGLDFEYSFIWERLIVSIPSGKRKPINNFSSSDKFGSLSYLSSRLVSQNSGLLSKMPMNGSLFLVSIVSTFLLVNSIIVATIDFPVAFKFQLFKVSTSAGSKLDGGS